MKRLLKRVSTLILFLVCSTIMYAQQAELVNFSIEPITVEAGQEVTVSVNMFNPSVDVASCIMGIVLPEGFSAVQEKAWNEDDEEWEYYYGSLTSRKRTKFVLSENYEIDKNILHFTINGMGQVFKETDGAIVTFKIKAGEGATSGVMKVYKQSWSNADASLGGERPDFDVNVTVTFPTKNSSATIKRSSDALYQLDGKKADNAKLSNGVYIKNGKKILKK